MEGRHSPTASHWRARYDTFKSANRQCGPIWRRHAAPVSPRVAPPAVRRRYTGADCLYDALYVSKCRSASEKGDAVGIGFTSFVTDMVLHPAYQQIIGLGPRAVPLLLCELAREPDHWFWALKAITGEDPVPPCSRGKLGEMTRAWLAWGKTQGYRW